MTLAVIVTAPTLTVVAAITISRTGAAMIAMSQKRCNRGRRHT